MKVYMIKRDDMIPLLNPLFAGPDVFKPLLTTTNATDPKDYSFILVDFTVWLAAVSRSTEWLYGIEKSMIQRFTKKYSKEIFDTSLCADEQSVEVMYNGLSEEFIREFCDMYLVFLSYIKNCQFRLFDLYETHSLKTSPAPLIPFSFAVNRLCNSLYNIEEVKSNDNIHVLGFDTNYGTNNEYEIQSCSVTDGVARTVRDSNIKLYTTSFKGDDLSPLPLEWRSLLSRIDPTYKTYESRLDLTKKLFSQYAYTGRQTINYADGTSESVFLVNYPIKMIGINSTITPNSLVKKVKMQPLI